MGHGAAGAGRRLLWGRGAQRQFTGTRGKQETPATPPCTWMRALFLVPPTPQQ